MMDPAALIERFIAALKAGEPRGHLVSDDFRFVGRPFSGMAFPLAGYGPDEAAAALARASMTLRFSDPVAGMPGRQLYEVLWAQGGGQAGGGSAGLQWVVFTASEDAVSEVRFFQDEQAARHYAGVREHPAGLSA